MKKVLIFTICALLIMSLAACGGDKNSVPDTQKADIGQKAEDKTDVGGTKESADNSDDNGKSDQTNENAVNESSDKADSADEAPVVESAEELENMVDEFNTTDDPERKEELRSQLEKILAQAEQQAASAD